MPPNVTTDMLGEEDPATRPRGEDTTTSLWGEETASTDAVGEETATTDAIGEEDGGAADPFGSPFGAF